MSAAQGRYTAVAIVLHWAIATAIIGNFLIGWWMHSAIEQAETQARAVNAFQMHKSLGLSILALSLLRLFWRWAHQPPPLPAGMPVWEVRAAKLTHWAFYGLMIGIPLSGWLYVSTQWRGDAALNIPTLWFGLFEVPHLFGLNAASLATRELLAGPFVETHEILAKGAALLLALHIGAALKHQFIDRDAVLSHMIPALEKGDTGQVPASLGRRIILGSGLGLIGLATLAMLYALFVGSANSNLTATNIETAPGSQWLIDPHRSSIQFSGSHAGNSFTGVFTAWRANIQLDPQHPEQSSITASIQTGSATDGVPLHDETLPMEEWFDVTQYPVAAVRSTGIQKNGPNSFSVDGVLNIKGHEIELRGFQLKLDGDQLSISGGIIVDRRITDLGMESDPLGEWVSLEIPVTLQLVASRK